MLKVICLLSEVNLAMSTELYPMYISYWKYRLLIQKNKYPNIVLGVNIWLIFSINGQGQLVHKNMAHFCMWSLLSPGIKPVISLQT